MATSYTDIFLDRVLPGLERLLEAEFKTALPIYISDQYEDHATESLRLVPVDAPLENELAVSEVRFYNVQGSYYTDLKPGRERIKEITRRLSRMNRIVITNRHYVLSGVYQWHHAQFNNFGRRSPDEAFGEPEGLGVGFFEFQCTVNEAIS